MQRGTAERLASAMIIWLQSLFEHHSLGIFWNRCTGAGAAWPPGSISMETAKRPAFCRSCIFEYRVLTFHAASVFTSHAVKIHKAHPRGNE